MESLTLMLLFVLVLMSVGTSLLFAWHSLPIRVDASIWQPERSLISPARSKRVFAAPVIWHRIS